MIEFQYNDGGREAAGFTGPAGDCVVRAIAIASELPYRVVYNEIAELAQSQRLRKGSFRSSPRNGVTRAVYEPFILRTLAWHWQPAMHIGSGCKVHLRAAELPAGRLIVSLSRHMTAVIDGVLHDTGRCDRFGTRCVYGYYYEGRRADV